MSDIRFARVFADGAVLQRGKKIRIWGFAKKGTEVTVSLAGYECACTAGESGRFDAEFPAIEKGGPYTLSADDKNGGTVVSGNIMIGDVSAGDLSE